ncbi:T cell receptor beta chain variable region [Clarias magur]|nr:T cell receptor beta chain variable region [Clarias magur]
MIRAIKVIIIACVIFLKGRSLSFTVHQKPHDVLMNEHDVARIECSQRDPRYNVIIWYKQSGDRDLQFLGYLYRKNKNIESGSNREIKLDGDGARQAFLIMENLLTNDSAVYYCAAQTHTQCAVSLGCSAKSSH